MKWFNPKHIPSAKQITASFKDSIILTDELIKRDLVSLSACFAFLDPQKYKQTSPFTFPEMEKSIDRIFRAVKEGERIGIWGDFDVDGQTSTAILYDALSQIKADVIYHIPNRATESHGMQKNAIKKFLEQSPTLIVTCDTGITDHESIAYAKSAGIDVIVTDHHVLPTQLPEAYSIINPHQLKPGHALSFLAGVGTAFQVIRALATKYDLVIEPNDYLDLVVLGTIADLAELKKENRFYAQMGLKKMNQQLRLSFSSLLEISQWRNNLITESTLGFNIAPRLNSAGRLSTASENIEFLLSTNEKFCNDMARKLESLNYERKQSVENIYESAISMIEHNPSLRRDSVLILANEGWNRGVLGIVAGKISELFNRPALLLNIDEDKVSGSARSIDGIDIANAMHEHKDLLTRYGGHAMAAGVSLAVDNLPSFSQLLKQTVGKQITKIPQEKPLYIDHFISLSTIGSTLQSELTKLAPFGKGNPAPIFASTHLKIINQKPFGNKEQYSRIKVQDNSGKTADIVSWVGKISAMPTENIDIAYYIRPDNYSSKKPLTLEYIDHREHVQDAVRITTRSFTHEIEDRRNLPKPITHLQKQLEQGKNLQVWYEGLDIKTDFPTVNRMEIKAIDNLVILTPPPSFSVLNDIVEKSHAKKVYLYSYVNQKDSLELFLSNLAGTLKHHFNKRHSELDLQGLAAKICFTKESILQGLSWLQAHGDIEYLLLDDNSVQVKRVRKQADDQLANIQKLLENTLAEVIAFREYYLRVEASQLFRIKT